MQDPVRVGPFAETGHVRVVIETPAGSRTKYTWDGDARTYRAGRVLPLGLEGCFETYVERQGREYKLVRTVGSRKALGLIEEATR